MSQDLNLPRLDEDGHDPNAMHEMLGAKTAADLDRLLDVPVTVSAVLGTARMPIDQLLKIAPGSLLELDRRVGEPIEIRINDRLVARGEVVLVDDRLGVTMTEIVTSAG